MVSRAQMAGAPFAQSRVKPTSSLPRARPRRWIPSASQSRGHDIRCVQGAVRRPCRGRLGRTAPSTSGRADGREIFLTHRPVPVKNAGLRRWTTSHDVTQNVTQAQLRGSANCVCRGPGRTFEVGETACLQTPAGPRLANAQWSSTHIVALHGEPLSGNLGRTRPCRVNVR